MTATTGGLDRQREKKLNRILEEVFSLPPDTQRSFLEEACADDGELLGEALAYLGHEADLGDFLEKPAAAALGTDTTPVSRFWPSNGQSVTPTTQVEVQSQAEAANSEGRRDPLLGTRIRHFRFLRLLGEGGMGKLYVGFDESLHREVAIKTIRSGLWRSRQKRALFLREARILSQLEHPNICRIYEYIEGDSNDFLVLELIRGRSLSEALREEMDGALKLRIAEQVAQALMAAHSRGITHADLKPMNIMLTEREEAKVLDFGIARTLGWRIPGKEPSAEGGEESSTGVGATLGALEGKILGTPGYMSPEQARGEQVTAPADIYSLSLVLQELFTGQPAYERNLPLDTLAVRMATGKTQPLRGLASDLTTLLEQMRALAPEDRPSAADVAARLQWITAVQSEGFPDTRPGPPSSEQVDEEGWGQVMTTGEGRRERRQVTVMSAELVPAGGGSLEFAPTLAVLEELAQYLATRWEGHLEKVEKQRIVLCFGYPSSREGEARRAVLAALELGEGVARLAEPEEPLALRAGLHTGLGVVSSDSLGEHLRLGPTRVIADKVCRLAAPGEVVVTDATHRLVERSFLFHVESVPDAAVGESVETLHRVVEARNIPVDDAFEMVSRREELDLLRGRWRLAHGGEGQGVLLVGAAGIGKSRLVREFVGRMAAEGTEVWSFHGSSEAQSSPLQPVLEPLRQALGLEVAEGSAQDLEQLETLLEEMELEAAEVLPYLAPILSLTLEERYQVPDLGPQRLKRKIQEALLNVFLASVQQNPRVLLVEDLHWLDPSTVELVGLLLEEVESIPLLMILTTRPEFEVPWSQQRAPFTQILLKPLASDETRRLIEGIIGSDAVAPEVQKLIADRTDGVPLFIEELTRDLVESGRLVEREGRWELAGQVERLDLPSTLRDSLSARLDRLGPARAVAQVASVLGRTFTVDLLASVTDAESYELQRLVDHLMRSGLLLRKGIGTRRNYLFKHALIREAAYDSLLERERRRLHGRVAEALESSPEVREQAPEQLAHHLTAAGEVHRATDWWLLAGQKAISHSAHREGCDHLGRGLAEVRKREPSKERDRHELAFLIRLGAASSVLKGYAAPELDRTWGRAQELCHNLTTSPQLFWVVWGLWSFHLVRAELDKAVDMGRWLRGMAESLGKTDLRLVAEQTLGLAYYFCGKIETAGEHLDRAMAFDDPERDHAISTVSGQDAGVVVLAARALVCWHRGAEEEGIRSMASAIELAEGLEHSYSIAFAHGYAARFYQSCGNFESVGEHARKVVELSMEKGYFWLAQGQFFLGLQAAEEARQCREEGNEEEATSLLSRAAEALRKGLASYRVAGARLSLTYMLAQVAEFHLQRGVVEKARPLLAEAFELIEGGERFWEADLLRLRGQAQLLEGHREEARRTFEDALALARERRDRAFEQRITEAITAL